ncbi:unnamed protein product [Pylaiella littoralis]
MTNDDWDGAASMHKALKALATSTRPISASRVKTAAAKALENVKEYKRVVHAIERYIRKAQPHHRIGGCFVIDSVCRQAQSKWGHKDVFTPRFAQRMAETTETLRHVPDRDKPPVFRVIREWHEKGMFKGLESFASGGAGAAGGAAGAAESYSHPQPPASQAAVSASPAQMGLPPPTGVIHLGLKVGDTYGSAYPPHSANGGGVPDVGVDAGAPATYAPSFGQHSGSSPPGGAAANGAVGGGGAGVGGWGGAAGDGLDEPLSDSRFVPQEAPLPEPDHAPVEGGNAGSALQPQMIPPPPPGPPPPLIAAATGATTNGLPPDMSLEQQLELQLGRQQQEQPPPPPPPPAVEGDESAEEEVEQEDGGSGEDDIQPPPPPPPKTEGKIMELWSLLNMAQASGAATTATTTTTSATTTATNAEAASADAAAGDASSSAGNDDDGTQPPPPPPPPPPQDMQMCLDHEDSQNDLNNPPPPPRQRGVRPISVSRRRRRHHPEKSRGPGRRRRRRSSSTIRSPLHPVEVVAGVSRSISNNKARTR